MRRRAGPVHRRRAEAGTASAELVALVVPIMVLVAFAVFAGRYSATAQEVTSAARDAALPVLSHQDAPFEAVLAALRIMLGAAQVTEHGAGGLVSNAFLFPPSSTVHLDGSAVISAMDPAKLPAIRGEIWQLMHAAQLHRDLGAAVGVDEADIAKHKISIASPIARALIGKEEGDTAEVQAPGGIKHYEIVAVGYF